MLTGAWVLALLMAGAPLAAIAGGNDGDDDAASASDPAEGEARDPDVTDPDAEEAPPPTDYEFVPGRGGDHVIAGFRPETDTLTLTSDTWDLDLFDLGAGSEGAALEILMGELRSVLRFPGLDALPVNVIFLHVSGPGTEPVLIALSDALSSELDDVLQPTDADAPDVLPGDPSSAPPLAPAHPDAPEAAEPLPPTDPDAPEDGGPP